MLSFLTYVVDLLFPEYCLRCGIRGTLLCTPCTTTIPFGISRITNDSVAAASYRDETIRNALWALKYRHKTHIADIFASPLHSVLAEALRGHNTPERVMLVPVPITRSRKRKRGFNQAETLAQAIASQDPGRFSVACIVRKKKDTLPQARTPTRDERFENLKDAFVVAAPVDADIPVIVVDDVTTTGATFKEMKKALRAAGAKRVLCFAVAH